MAAIVVRQHESKAADDVSQSSRTYRAASHIRPNEIVRPLIVAVSKGIPSAEKAAAVKRVSKAVNARAVIVFFIDLNTSQTAAARAARVSKKAAKILFSAFSCCIPLS